MEELEILKTSYWLADLHHRVAGPAETDVNQGVVQDGCHRKASGKDHAALVSKRLYWFDALSMGREPVKGRLLPAVYPLHLFAVLKHSLTSRSHHINRLC